MVPPVVVHSILMKLPLVDLEVLGFPVKTVENSHPVGCILSVLPVLPPVSRPAMRTLNLKTGQPFVVEDFLGACCYFLLSKSTMHSKRQIALPLNIKAF